MMATSDPVIITEGEPAHMLRSTPSGANRKRKAAHMNTKAQPTAAKRREGNAPLVRKNGAGKKGQADAIKNKKSNQHPPSRRSPRLARTPDEVTQDDGNQAVLQQQHQTPSKVALAENNDSTIRSGSSDKLTQSALKGSFETKVKSVLPQLWKSEDGIEEVENRNINTVRENFIQSATQSLVMAENNAATDNSPLLRLSRQSSASLHGSPTNTEQQLDESSKLPTCTVSPASSPIRKPSKLPTLRCAPPLPQSKSNMHALFLDGPDSSPTARKKTVGFSDNIECFSSPTRSSPMKGKDPQLKPILKAIRMEGIISNPLLGVDEIKNGELWASGSVIQLPVDSDAIPILIQRSVRDLADTSFAFKFEAYTSLNHILKSNLTSRADYFSPFAIELLGYIKRDITETKEYEDPFITRISTQAFKLASFFLSDWNIHNILASDFAKDFIMLCCAMIQSQDITKSIASVLLQLLRDQTLPATIVTPRVGEYIIQAILNMKTFASISLTIERINTLKQYVKQHPAMMAKNHKVWLPFLFINLTDTSSVAFLRIVKASYLLLQAILDMSVEHPALTFAIQKLISQPLSVAFSGAPSQSQSQIDPESIEKDIILSDYLISKLHKLTESNLSLVLQVWSIMTSIGSLSGNTSSQWHLEAKWLEIFAILYKASNSPESDDQCLSAWQSIVCSIVGTINANNDLRKSAVALKLMMYPFRLKLSKSLHKLFVSILLGMLVQVRYFHKSVNTPFDQIWSHIVTEAFDNFYFHPDFIESGGMAAAKIMIRFLNQKETKFKLVKLGVDKQLCLGENCKLKDATIAQLPSLPPRWVRHRHTYFYKYLITIFNLNEVDREKKVELFNSFITTLSLSTTREMKNNGKVADLVAGIPELMANLFDNITISKSEPYDFIIDLVIKLNDALGVGALIDDSATHKNSCHSIISAVIAIDGNSPQRLIELCDFISNTLGHRLQLAFYEDLFELKTDVLRNFVLEKINERKFSKMAIADYSYLSTIIRQSTQGEVKNDVIISLFSYIANPMVEKHPSKAIELLKIEQWDSRAFMLAIRQLMQLRDKSPLVRDSHMQEILKFLISSKLSSADSIDVVDQCCTEPEIWKFELLKYSLFLQKSFKTMWAANVEKRPLIENAIKNVLNMYENDEFGLKTFEGISELLSMENADPEREQKELAILSDTVAVSKDKEEPEPESQNLQVQIGSVELLMDSGTTTDEPKESCDLIDESISSSISLPGQPLKRPIEEDNKSDHDMDTLVLKKSKLNEVGKILDGMETSIAEPHSLPMIKAAEQGIGSTEEELGPTQVIDDQLIFAEAGGKPVEEEVKEAEQQGTVVIEQEEEMTRTDSVSLADQGLSTIGMIDIAHQLSTELDKRQYMDENEKNEIENVLLKAIMKLRGLK